AALLTVAFLAPPHAVGYLALGVGLVSAWPQVYDSFAAWRSPAESGVSITTWAIKVISQTSWLTYAVITRDIPVVLSATVALSTAASLVAVESSRRLAGRRRAALAPALELV